MHEIIVNVTRLFCYQDFWGRLDDNDKLIDEVTDFDIIAKNSQEELLNIVTFAKQLDQYFIPIILRLEYTIIDSGNILEIDAAKKIIEIIREIQFNLRELRLQQIMKNEDEFNNTKIIIKKRFLNIIKLGFAKDELYTDYNLFDFLVDENFWEIKEEEILSPDFWDFKVRCLQLSTLKQVITHVSSLCTKIQNQIKEDILNNGKILKRIKSFLNVRRGQKYLEHWTNTLALLNLLISNPEDNEIKNYRENIEILVSHMEEMCLNTREYLRGE